jgi:iron complex transport system ATP-binding protein
MIDRPISLEHVSVRYGTRTALRDVSLDAGAGELIALTGPNGSGKSTLLRAAVGLEVAEEGAIRLGLEPLGALSLRARAQRVGWMPQEEPAGDNLPAVEYVRYGRFPHSVPFAPEPPGDRRAVDQALRLAGAEELRDRLVWELSGGERQRVRLARVLAQQAPLLLLDEPTAHLDIGHQLDVLARVRGLVRDAGTTAIIALHDLNLAARFADRIVVLHHGRTVASGAPREVLSPRLLFDVWGIVSELRYDAASRLPYLIPRTVPAPPAPDPPGTDPRRRVHVMAGGGSGTELLRRLVDAGFSLTAGALPLFDSDSATAEELRIPTAVEVPFAPISEETRAQVRTFLSESAVVVVAPFPVGPANVANLEELVGYGHPGAIYLIAQPSDRPWDFTGGLATAIRAELRRQGAVEVENLDRLAEALGARGEG